MAARPCPQPTPPRGNSLLQAWPGHEEPVAFRVAGRATRDTLRGFHSFPNLSHSNAAASRHVLYRRPATSADSDAQPRADRAVALAHLGAPSAARAALEASPLALATDETRAVLRDPSKRPENCQVLLRTGMEMPLGHLDAQLSICALWAPCRSSKPAICQDLNVASQGRINVHVPERTLEATRAPAWRHTRAATLSNAAPRVPKLHDGRQGRRDRLHSGIGGAR